MPLSNNGREIVKLIYQLSLIFVFSLTAVASSKKLVHITNDEDKSFYHLGVNVDEDTNEADSLYKREFDAKGKVVAFTSYSLGDLVDGVTLVSRGKHKVVNIKASNLNPSDGADISVDTLYSGISNDRKEYSASVERVGSDWKFNFNNRPVSKLHFVTNKKFIIGVVGIKKIETK